jgi:hypothetical protein
MRGTGDSTKPADIVCSVTLDLHLILSHPCWLPYSTFRCHYMYQQKISNQYDWDDGNQLAEGFLLCHKDDNNLYLQCFHRDYTKPERKVEKTLHLNSRNAEVVMRCNYSC